MGDDIVAAVAAYSCRQAINSDASRRAYTYLLDIAIQVLWWL
jgi:hypothetical protein